MSCVKKIRTLMAKVIMAVIHAVISGCIWDVIKGVIGLMLSIIIPRGTSLEFSRKSMRKKNGEIIKGAVTNLVIERRGSQKKPESLKVDSASDADLQKGMEAYEIEDYATALDKFTPLAEAGNTFAQHILGLIYYFGQGVEPDYKEAIKWYRLAAEAGLPTAQHNLGEMYLDGEGVEVDYKEAAKWHRLAAEAGDIESQVTLGWMYSVGRGVRQNFAEAAKWYRRAAKVGNASAQRNLGVMHELGQGARQDDRLAYMWYNLAAAQGHEKAKENRDEVAHRMTPEQIAEAKKMAEDMAKKIAENH